MNLEEYKGVYVFAQQVDNEISGIAYELLGQAVLVPSLYDVLLLEFAHDVSDCIFGGLRNHLLACALAHLVGAQAAGHDSPECAAAGDMRN